MLGEGFLFLSKNSIHHTIPEISYFHWPLVSAFMLSQIILSWSLEQFIWQLYIAWAICCILDSKPWHCESLYSCATRKSSATSIFLCMRTLIEDSVMDSHPHNVWRKRREKDTSLKWSLIPKYNPIRWFGWFVFWVHTSCADHSILKQLLYLRDRAKI
jgi:hypothetical protein